MNLLTRTASIAALSAVLILSSTAQSFAQGLQPIQWRSKNDYDVILLDGLFGTAIGGAAGLTIGVLSDAESENIFSDFILPGIGIGAISGVLYALLYNSPSFYDRMYMNNGQPKGLLHFDADLSALDIHPARVLPRQEYRKAQDDAVKWRCDLFTMSF